MSGRGKSFHRNSDLVGGPITRTMLLFAFPMILGNLLQQLYNVADTLIVGQFLGADALAAVGSAYTLMTFLTSILLGLCMGSGAVFSIRLGEQDEKGLRESILHAFLMIALLAVILNAAVFLLIDPILYFLRVPSGIYGMMREYLWIIFLGILATFLYNFFASLLRAVGNSVVPLYFLGICAVLNIVLDLLFVIRFGWGVAGAAAATVISQYVSGAGLFLYTFLVFPEYRIFSGPVRLRKKVFREITQFSLLTCLQQSVMNLGILMVQGLVNSFGTERRNAFRQGSEAPWSAPWFSAWRSACWCSCSRNRCFCFLSSRKRRRSWRSVCSICGLRVRSTAGSAACFCCTDCTGRWSGRECRWF